MKSKLGYLTIDHRFSPGIDANLASQLGITDNQSLHGLFEADVATCCHCQATVVLNPMRTRPRAQCAKCNRYVCDNPLCQAECRNYDSLMNAIEAKIRETEFYLL